MATDNRKVGNYLKSAGLSKSYYLHVFAGGIGFLGILMAYASKMLSEVNMVAGNLPDPNISAALQDRVFTAAILFFVCFFCFVGCTVFYMVVLAQRVGGPITAICGYIEELKKGNFDAKRSLRKNDELGPILEELKDLAQILKQKKDSPG